MLTAADERRHAPAGDDRWAESWWFDFAARDASLGGFVRLSLHPHHGVAWCWAALVGRGRRLLLVRDQDLEAPRGQALDVRGQGLWTSATCETPLEHWSVGLEAFAVAFDDPREALAAERGDLVGLGFDLEWEASGPAEDAGQTGYHQPCRVGGEILVADEQLDFEGVGFRGHRWGIEDWWQGRRQCLSAVLEDGTALWLATSSRAPGTLAVTSDAAGLVTGADAVADSLLSVHVEPVAPAPLLVEGAGGRRACVATALSRLLTSDGRHGVGWLASLWAQT